MHDARVYARSDGLSRGSSFIVQLPLSAAPLSAHETVPAENAKTDQAAATHRILVVDDNENAANGLGDLLRVMGHDVQIAYNGLQALDMAAPA